MGACQKSVWSYGKPRPRYTVLKNSGSNTMYVLVQYAKTLCTIFIVNPVRLVPTACISKERRGKPHVNFFRYYSYFTHRWGILLFTPPPGSRVWRLGWSQYMHECVGASQGYHGVYCATQTVLSRCCHGYSGIPKPVRQIPYLPHRQEPTNHPIANPNPNPNPPTTPW